MISQYYDISLWRAGCAGRAILLQENGTLFTQRNHENITAKWYPKLNRGWIDTDGHNIRHYNN